MGKSVAPGDLRKNAAYRAQLQKRGVGTGAAKP